LPNHPPLPGPPRRWYASKRDRRRGLTKEQRNQRSLRNFKSLPGVNLLYSKVDLDKEDEDLDQSFGLLKKGEDTSLITVDSTTGDLKKLPWEHEHDTQEVPLELRAMYKGTVPLSSHKVVSLTVEIDSERAREEVLAKKIGNMIDYQIYHDVLRQRIYQVEDAYALSAHDSYNLSSRTNLSYYFHYRP